MQEADRAAVRCHNVQSAYAIPYIRSNRFHGSLEREPAGRITIADNNGRIFYKGLDSARYESAITLLDQIWGRIRHTYNERTTNDPH